MSSMSGRAPVKEPKLVEVPAGEYTMGSPAQEEGRFRQEGPQHPVTVSTFQAGKFPVTKGEYRAFVEASGRAATQGGWAHDDKLRWVEVPNLTWEDPGFEQDDDHPVVFVSWEDATAYATWLAEATDKRYRLLTEAEWEYSARGGTTTPYHFGNQIPEGGANCMGPREPMPPFMAKRRGTWPVSSCRPNAFGLHGVHGNVWEWVDDRWRDAYDRRPPEKGDTRQGEDGNWGQCSCVLDYADYEFGGHGPRTRRPDVVQEEPCRGRVIRGGAWANQAKRCRSASRIGWDPGYRGYSIGFRVTCSLDGKHGLTGRTTID